MPRIDGTFFNQDKLMANVHGKAIIINSTGNSTDTSAYTTVATFSAQNTHIQVSAISGHNSGGFTYSGSASTYTYNVGQNTIRQLWSGSGTGAMSCRLLINSGGYNNGTCELQVIAASIYVSNVYFYIASGVPTWRDPGTYTQGT